MDLKWGHLRPIAEEAFRIWADHPEWRFARRAWIHLRRAGLTDAGTPLDRTLAYVRFFVLASLYRDWCCVVWDEVDDDSPAVWAAAAPDPPEPIHLGQLVGPDVDLGDDSDELIDAALLELMRRERPAVVKALLQGFGCVDLLFVELWRSRRDQQGSLFSHGDSDAEEDEILNDPNEEKLAGYQWLTEGCPWLGPQRFCTD